MSSPSSESASRKPSGSEAEGAIGISRVVPDDLAALAEAELLAFSASDPFTSRLRTFRADLARAGIAPHRWPDYAGAIRRNARVLQDGALLLKATRGVAGAEGAGEGLATRAAESAQEIVGMVWLTPPARIVAEEKSRTRTSKLDALLSLGSIRKFLKTAGEPDGTNYVFLNMYLSEAKRVREEILKGRECYFMYVPRSIHPAFPVRCIT